MPTSAEGVRVPSGISAYIMLAEPYWLRASVLSYYDYVDRIVVSHDRRRRGWTGDALDLDGPLRILADLDVDHKMEFLVDDFFTPGVSPMEQETRQREITIQAVAKTAEWCLQLDTDEVAPHMPALLDAIERADAAGYDAVDYPSRWIYARIGDSDRFLERSTRWWRTSASYPGAMAVRPSTKLRIARQTVSPSWRVDFRSKNTDPSHQRGTVVHQVVPYEHAIQHFSWVRPEAGLRAKGNSSGHANDFDWNAATDLWVRRQRHPLLSCVTTPLPRRPFGQRLRLARVPGVRDML